MQNQFLLEISVETMDAAMAAERGGAQRIELCANLAEGGTTPSLELMREARQRIRLPVFAMVRPRSGNFVYSEPELEAMRRDIDMAKSAGMNGVVLGALRSNGQVDVANSTRLAQLAKPLPVTFHRAFDATRDFRKSLDDVIETGAARILTSGGALTAPEGLATLAAIVAAAGDRIIIVPGSGINATNISQVAERTRACEFHSGLSSSLAHPCTDYTRFEAEVRKLSGFLESFPQAPANVNR